MRSDLLGMAVRTGLQATLDSSKDTTLFVARFQKCRLTLTGTTFAEEFVLQFKVVRLFGPSTAYFQAAEVKLSLWQTLLSARIVAKPPPGVATVDIVYDVQTGADA
jgi:hypothetical protein